MDSSQFLSTFTIDSTRYHYYSLNDAEKAGWVSLQGAPYVIRVLAENLLRNKASRDHVQRLRCPQEEISFFPSRVLMQDFTGVPAIVDLAAMREALHKAGGNPSEINPQIPVDLIIDHSVAVHHSGTQEAFSLNTKKDFYDNKERYRFLKWAQNAFQNLNIIPPGQGICHQINLEHLARIVWTSPFSSSQSDQSSRDFFAYSETVVGTDSHTTMINGLSVLGWGVGGIEAEAALLGQPLSLLVPHVVGVRLEGTLREGVTATDLVLHLTHRLRQQGVVGKFVEFFGEGVAHLSLADRATLANMAPEYGATCGFFPVDEETLSYLSLTGRSPHHIDLVRTYSQKQGLWRSEDLPEYDETLFIPLEEIIPVVAGPRRPQDLVPLTQVPTSWTPSHPSLSSPASGKPLLKEGDVVIAALTSCTNTSNPSVMIAAGLLAQKARALGLSVPPWVKTSLAPGSQVVMDYLHLSGLQESLDQLGFYLVGYGCTTCIGNSGPLAPEYVQAINEHQLAVASVLSGNRNFEGRVNPHVKLNYLASPPLVVAYALAGTLTIDLTMEPLGKTPDGHPVFLREIWPSSQEIHEVMERVLHPSLFLERYKNILKGGASWQSIESPQGLLFSWDENSSYIQCPPYFQDTSQKDWKTVKGRVVGIFGDSLTTDHISPAGSIRAHSPAAQYLESLGISERFFHSYGARRGNHHVMIRGTFANSRLINEMAPDHPGGYTCFQGKILSLFEAAQHLYAAGERGVVVAGKEYGTGSSRDWAAKGTKLLGISVVLAESFERIHRSNLVGMGVLPCTFLPGDSRHTWLLKGEEILEFHFPQSSQITPRMTIDCCIVFPEGRREWKKVQCRIDTKEEVIQFQKGGLLPFILEKFLPCERK